MGKFGPKKSKLSVLPENWHKWYLEDVNSNSIISFLNFLPEIYFWANLGWKIQSCLFCLKIGTCSISRMLIPVLILVFSNFHPKSRVYWFLFWDYFYKIPNLIPFFGSKFESKKLNSLLFLEAGTQVSWRCEYLEDSR